MTLTEIATLVIGAVVGYGVVSFVTRKSGEAANEEAPHAAAPAAPPPAAPPAAEPHWQDVLGVPEFATPGDIRAAYRRAISLVHPDKVATLDPELRALAERKAQALNAAYREAMESRGEQP